MKLVDATLPLALGARFTSHGGGGSGGSGRSELISALPRRLAADSLLGFIPEHLVVPLEEYPEMKDELREWVKERIAKGDPGPLHLVKGEAWTVDSEREAHLHPWNLLWVRKYAPGESLLWNKPITAERLRSFQLFDSELFKGM